MVNRTQSLRSSVAKNRPTGRLPGEIYTNWPDKQIGVIDSGGNALDLVAVRFFSATTSYAIGDVVLQAGALYVANAAVAAGAFNPAQWNKLQTAADINGYAYLPIAGGTLTGPLTLAADPATNLQATTKQYVDLHAGAVTVAASPPASPNPGALWWDSVSGQLFISYNDGSTTQWVIAVTTTATGALPLTGGTMTGPLVLAADPTVALGASTKQYVDANYLPLAGGTLTGNLNGVNASMSGSVVANGGEIDIIGSTYSSLIMIKGASGNSCQIAAYNKGSGTNQPRWNMIMGDGSAESGGNAGSNFYLYRYADNGTTLEASMYMNRASGLFTVGSRQGNAAINGGDGISWGGTSGNGFIVQSSLAGGQPFSVNRTAAAGTICAWYLNSAGCGSITATGTTCAYNTTSDGRLKEDRKPIDAGPILDALEPVNFKWKDTDVRGVGVIAQDAVKVFPDAVAYTEHEDAWGVDYSKFVPLLLAEIKALRMRVAALEAAR